MIHRISRAFSTSSARRPHSAALYLTAAVAAATLVAWPQTAAAETVVGVDLNFNDALVGEDAGNVFRTVLHNQGGNALTRLRDASFFLEAPAEHNRDARFAEHP